MAVIRWIMFATLAGWTASAQIPPPSSQQGSQPPPASSTPSGSGALASIAGVIRLNGAPAAAALITLFEGDVESKHGATDASGHYSFSDITPGRIRLQIKRPSGAPLQVSIVLQPGEKKLNNNITISEGARISGKVTDEDKKPLKGIQVRSIAANFAYGALRYSVSGTATTNEAGDYTILGIQPGGAYFVLALNRLSYSPAISDAPVDPEMRKPVLMPAYYPGTESIETAMPVTVPQGGQRELIDIQMKPAPSRCMEGRIVTPEGSSKPTLYEIGENDPPLWTVNARISVGPRTPASADGKFRVCDLHPGNYWIKTYQDGDPNGGHGIEYVSIGDKDVSGIVAAPQRFFPIDVSAVWEGKPPDTVESEGLGLTLTSTIGEYGNQSVDFSPKLPRTFNAAVHNHGYALSLRNIPAAGYVKDVTYGGRSILNQVFEPGASAAFDGLRIVLARDGARVSVKAVDKDGNAVADANVVIMPMNVTSEAAMAGGMVTGQTDSFGAWLSAPIAPGKYYVIATPTPVNRSFDTIAKLWRARAAAEVVELGAGATVQANRVPIVIE